MNIMITLGPRLKHGAASQRRLRAEAREGEIAKTLNCLPQHVTA
jgi:hypothetical protein